MYYPCYEPKQRWQSAHVYINELLKSYDLLKKCELPIEDLNQIYLIGQIQAIRALRVAYGFAPVSKEGDYEIDVLEPFMGDSLFAVLQKIVNYAFQFQYYAGYGAHILFNGDKIDPRGVEIDSNLYDTFKAERLKKLGAYLGHFEEVFFQLYFEESYDELSYYSPYEKFNNDEVIIRHVIQSGVCQNEEEVWELFGVKDEEGEIKLEVDFFDEKYPQFKEHQEKLIEQYAREDHSNYYYSQKSEIAPFIEAEKRRREWQSLPTETTNNKEALNEPAQKQELDEIKTHCQILLSKAQETIELYKSEVTDKNLCFEDEYDNDCLVHLEVLYTNMQCFYLRTDHANFPLYAKDILYYIDEGYKEIENIVETIMATPHKLIKELITWPCNKEIGDPWCSIRSVEELEEEAIKDLPVDTFIIVVDVYYNDFSCYEEFFTVTVPNLDLRTETPDFDVYARQCCDYDQDNLEPYLLSYIGENLAREIYINGKLWKEVGEGIVSFSDVGDYGFHYRYKYFDGTDIIEDTMDY